MSARCASVSTFCTSVGCRVQASLGDSRRRRGGRGDAPPDPVHDRARLAGHEPVRRRTHLDPHWVEAGPAALRHGLIDDLTDARVHDDYRFPGADHLRREYRAVEDQLR